MKAYGPLSSFEIFVAVVVSAMVSFEVDSLVKCLIMRVGDEYSDRPTEFEMYRLFETRDDGKYYLILIDSKSCVGDFIRHDDDKLFHADSLATTCST